jgi:flavin-dependent thymidylate synthase
MTNSQSEHSNSVILLGFYGSDLSHAQSAWTSTIRDLSEDKLKRVPSLLKMLADQGHHTPFEKSTLHFLVNTDIASHIHLLKSRIGVSINGESARYKELKEDKYYLPDDWDSITNSSHLAVFDSDRGLYKPNEIEWSSVLEEYTKLGNDLYHKCLKDLEPVLGRKRAKESARFFKTYNSQIQSDVIFNFRSFHHFLELRNKPDAQKEIRDIAATMLNLVKTIEGNPFKYTIEAFGH